MSRVRLVAGAGLLAAAVVGGFAGPATADPLLEYCHADQVRYGFVVNNPVSGRQHRLCIEGP